MIRTLEISEVEHRHLEQLPMRVQEMIRDRECGNCLNKVLEGDNILYVKLKKEVVWWHEYLCGKNKKKKPLRFCKVCDKTLKDNQVRYCSNKCLAK